MSSQQSKEFAVYEILALKRAELCQIICCLMSNTGFINWLIFGMVKFERATKLDCTFLWKNKTTTQTQKNESPSFFCLAISMLYMPSFNLKLSSYKTAFGLRLICTDPSTLHKRALQKDFLWKQLDIVEENWSQSYLWYENYSWINESVDWFKAGQLVSDCEHHAMA